MRHLIPKEAKCTIDTGNLQGNIVSRAFVVDVLGFTESDFQSLTKAEEDGGTGVTGHKLIPDGAIYLTWYHINSTRVFRDMRFLISEHPMYDLIIGAQSIQKNNILDIPNLATQGGRVDLDEDKSTPISLLSLFFSLLLKYTANGFVGSAVENLRSKLMAEEETKRNLEKQRFKLKIGTPARTDLEDEIQNIEQGRKAAQKKLEFGERVLTAEKTGTQVQVDALKLRFKEEFKEDLVALPPAEVSGHGKGKEKHHTQ
jgi:hypothetical protein